MLLGMPSLSLGASCPYPDMQTCPLSLYNLPVYLCANNITKMAHLWTILILRDIDSLTPVLRPCQRSTLINKGQVNGFVYRGGIQTEAIVLAAQRQSSQICRCSTYREQNRKMDFMSKQSCRLPEPKKTGNQDMLKLSLWLPIQQGDAQCNSEIEFVKYNACSAMIW